MGHRTDIDWELIEREYRLGVKTDVQLSTDHQVSRSAIVRRAKKEGWSKDLSALVKLETKAKVSAAIVKEATEKLHQSYTKDATAVEIEAVDNALMIAEHERFGTKGRKLFEDALDLIGEQIRTTPSVELLIEMLDRQSEDATPALRKVLSIPTMFDAAKKAMEGGARSVEVERKARGMDDKGAGEQTETMEDAVAAIKALKEAASA